MKKILKHKVEFSANGKYAVFKFSDDELKKLIGYDDGKQSSKWGWLYNFSAFALFDYDINSRSKRGRFHSIFNYHDFEKMIWRLMEENEK